MAIIALAALRAFERLLCFWHGELGSENQSPPILILRLAVAIAELFVPLDVEPHDVPTFG